MKVFLVLGALLFMGVVNIAHANDDYGDGIYHKNFRSPTGNIVCFGDGVITKISE